jgi:hypothetical protein
MYSRAAVWRANGGTAGPPETPLVFLDGKTASFPTFYAGALRIRVLPRGTGASANGGPVHNAERGTQVTVEISPEPKVGLRSIMSVQVEKVVDEQGNVRKPPLPYIGGADDFADLDMRLGAKVYFTPDGQTSNLSQRVPLRFHLPEGVKKVKELHGTVAAEVLTPMMPLITIDNILDAAGKTADGRDGGNIKVSEVKRDDKGQVIIDVTLEKPPLAPPVFVGRRMRVMRGGGYAEERGNDVNTVGRFLSLVDEKGQGFKLAAVEEKPTEAVGAVEYLLTFQPPEGAAAAAKLSYLGRKKTTIDVPFVLKDVPVP